MSIDGLEWDAPDSAANAAAFGYPGSGKDGSPAVFPKAKSGDDRGVRVAPARI
jgi:hypothetical protein